MSKLRDHEHYERAFEAWLRQRRVPYVPVQQVGRAADREGPLKNFDYLVHAGPRHYIVDVKGKHFPQTSRGRDTWWENWIHYADLEGLFAWESHFGEGYTALLVYCYWLQLPPGDESARKTLTTGGRDYLLVAIPARTFAENCRRRSTRWQAVHVPMREFTSLVRPVEHFISDASGPLSRGQGE
jgi:hypothetical protein